MQSYSPITPAETQTERDKDILDELIDMGVDIARVIHKKAMNAAESDASADPTIPFGRIATTIRKTIALARSLDKPRRADPERLQACITALRRKPPGG